MNGAPRRPGIGRRIVELYCILAYLWMTGQVLAAWWQGRPL
ncbi:hypothetical protein [Sphingomonas sp. KC8]|nr:hypothetical protein [Sphingomonas sp. KC8]ARS27638.1 hypothetical protein KC8_10070 [Sphingomonas sp. KC8]